MAFVVDEDERREVDDFDLPHGFHAEFGIIDDLDLADVLLREDGGGPADRPEVEAAVRLAGLGDGLAAVALGDHDERAAVLLEELDVAVHAAGGGRAERARGHADRRLGGTGVVDGVILEVLGQAFALLEAFADLGVRDVAGDDERTGEGEARGDGVLRELGADLSHRAVEVDLHDLGGVGMLAGVGGNKASGILLKLLNPDAILVDLGLGVAVGGTGDGEADRTRGAVARQADDADVEREPFAAELRADAEGVRDLQELGLEGEVAEGAAVLVARSRERVVVVGRGQLDGLHGRLGGGAADDEGEVVRRAGRGAERLHLLGQELDEGLRVQDGLGLLVEVALVGGAAAFGHEEELELHALGRGEVDLRGQVGPGVLLGVEVERRELGITQVVLRVGLVDAERKGLGVVAAGPDLLALLAGDLRGAGVLAERQHALRRDLGVAQHRQRDGTVVVASLGVREDRGDLLKVLGAEVEIDIMQRLVGEQREGLRGDLEDRLAGELGDGHMLLGQQAVLRAVRAQRKRVLVMERGSHRRPAYGPRPRPQTEIGQRAGIRAAVPRRTAPTTDPSARSTATKASPTVPAAERTTPATLPSGVRNS